MRFTCKVEINAPREKVVEAFLDNEKQKQWQDGFIGKEQISGEPFQKNAVAMMKYKRGNGVMELKETILLNELPDEFSGLYEHKHMINTMTSRFTSIDGEKTLFEAKIHYMQTFGLMPKLMMKLFPGMMKKQTQKWLDQFKAAVEKD